MSENKQISESTKPMTDLESEIFPKPTQEQEPPVSPETSLDERAHLRQFRRYTLPGMALLYLLVPLPAGLAWFRARFEMEGYAETVRAAAEVHGLDHVRRADFREYVVSQFLSGAYGWMWPFRRSIERWYDKMILRLEAERGPAA